jgi:hypothetical protein
MAPMCIAVVWRAATTFGKALNMDYEGQKMDLDVQKMDLTAVLGR